MAMHSYEMMLILNPQLDENKVKKILDKYLEIITKDKGTITKTDIWGRRKLAYEIDKKTEGIYALVYYTCSPQADAELQRQLKFNEDIMRFKVLRKDK